MIRLTVLCLACITLLFMTTEEVQIADASTRVAAAEKGEGEAHKESPWLILPTLASNPKLGTSLGVMASYLHYFDERSKVSMFGATAQYTSTDSTIGGAFAKVSFGADHHRVAIFTGGGLIKNDYNDFLGSGRPLKTEDNLLALAGRYLYRVKNDWFAGVQAVFTNYLIIGQSTLDEQVLSTLGLTGFRSGGIGIIVTHDSRDNEYSPAEGWYVNLNNIAYREWLGGGDNFDVYRLDLKGFWEHWGGQVFAVRQHNQWTVDAPPAAYAPVTLRGYKMGQYLGKYMSSLEGEERIRLSKRWGATLFVGMACLYGGGEDCTDSANGYPAFGGGFQYIVKEKERMVLNLEYAQGKSENYGIYLQFGYGF